MGHGLLSTADGLSLDFLDAWSDDDSSKQAYLSALLRQLSLTRSGAANPQSDGARSRYMDDVATLLDSAISAGRDVDGEAIIDELLTVLAEQSDTSDNPDSASALDITETAIEAQAIPLSLNGLGFSELIAAQQAFADHPLVQKVGMTLAMLSPTFSMEGMAAGAIARTSFSSQSANLQLSNGGVVIEAIASGEAQPLLADLQTLGLEGSAFGNTVSGWLPLTAIGALADLDSLMSARPSYAITRVGLVTSEADQALAAEIARTTFDVDGSGLTIGILSDSFEATTGANGSYAEDIASGDLPDDVTVLADFFFASDEGRAMAQLIHDLAPGADLVFRTAFRGPADFANGILELVDAGADVIVDDIGYLDQPFFQDGVIAQAVDQAVAAGVPYFSAAGNSGADSYEDSFRFGQAVGNYRFHDFDPGNGVDVFQQFTLGAGESITLSFQWDEPFRSSGGSSATSDLDVFILDEAEFSGANIVASGIDDNIASGDAFEFFSFTNTTGRTQDFHIAFGRDTRQGGSDPGRVKYIDFDGQASNFEFATNSSTSFGHPNATGAAGVGAAFYADTPAFGTSPPELEPFSSLGGLEILFDVDGNRLPTPELRQSVDFVAADGTNTTFFFSDSAADADSFPNFFGTSAAAPHAAAIAALMLEAANEAGIEPTPEDIYDALEASAIDMDNPFTAGFDVGYDFATGFGLIQADGAIEALLDNLSPNGEIINGTAARDTLIGTPGDDIITGFERRDVLVGGDGSDQFVYITPDDRFDRIEDFEVGIDKIVLTTLLQNLGYEGNTPVADGYIGVSDQSIRSSAILLLDIDGGGDNLMPFAQVKDVTPAELSNLDNFII